jgi:hypothetical protein
MDDARAGGAVVSRWSLTQCGPAESGVLRHWLEVPLNFECFATVCHG